MAAWTLARSATLPGTACRVPGTGATKAPTAGGPATGPAWPDEAKAGEDPIRTAAKTTTRTLKRRLQGDIRGRDVYLGFKLGAGGARPPSRVEVSSDLLPTLQPLYLGERRSPLDL